MGLVTNRLEEFVVTARQMAEIEGRVFDAGMPVAALMEKVGNLIARRIQELYPIQDFPKVGILVGPGHNGGDALVIARELYFQGYDILIYRPLSKSKELSASHARFVKSLGIQFHESVEPLKNCDILIDGIFGYGQERSLKDPIASAIDQINQWSNPVLSIDIPTGLHTDTGDVLGTAIRADRTFCIGLWKLGLLQDHALEYIGSAELINIDLPLADVEAVLRQSPSIQRLTKQSALAHLPLPRPLSTYKYKMGSLLLICGSHQYSGGAILTSLGARASGVGMLYIAVPESLQLLLSDHLPEALILSCPETKTGAIAQLPNGIELSKFDAIACGPGLTTDAKLVVEHVLESDRPLVLDADALNIVAQMGTIPTITQRQAPTVLTPHAGEFKRLFGEMAKESDRLTTLRSAAQQSKAVIVLKGARTAIASPQGYLWINPESTPALARGGSGDVLTGLVGGLISQGGSVESVVNSAVWWHAHAGILAASERTELGVDAFTLTQFLIPVLKASL
ncbi:NAD(P)H-hydrate dehydratase [Aetokthonos hydrillicola Thurmond2011]|jgi:NAD(P)H-hydrate epimerase|uniref:Bifunctional NAD(P)H-hydrate repair enzyme n=1 Tax=Aetokthonos hydrillicola Thurmond2011 TaxID=2712845 RepID=A0AAP5IA96_9CYAN|nr:NAD(P)H-hydrate dehydratase [Aetokthonos hydrillicola]MBO3463317.1 NAD(P)H-hydrate dehydratase [Aetokthonos hydrillicola CCALA 1050]MBW4584818.1 NAD(P)H-hydrate dehydratase [Aetokthonos hydrillicola CCALA 1050]MDR9895365.1 NAD(P)H-hydrate dehydratase [Aetokthonos hydrillicola Thurmond2011]